MPPGRWPDGRLLPGWTLPEIWVRRWMARPDAPVLVDGWGHTSVTGTELDRLTARGVSVLAARGVGPGDRVLWQARATLESVAALVTVLRAGAVLVPVSPSSAWPRGGPCRGRCHSRAGPLPGGRTRRPLRSRNDGRQHRAAVPRGRAGAAGHSARGAARRRRPHRLHLRHHRQAQGRHPHARVAAGGHHVAARGLGVERDGPPRPLSAAVPRARSVRRTLRHPRRRRLRRRVRSLRREGCPRCGIGQHHVLRRPHHVPPAGGLRTAPATWPGYASACLVRRPWQPTSGTGSPPRVSPSWSATA